MWYVRLSPLLRYGREACVRCGVFQSGNDHCPHCNSSSRASFFVCDYSSTELKLGALCENAFSVGKSAWLRCVWCFSVQWACRGPCGAYVSLCAVAIVQRASLLKFHADPRFGNVFFVSTFVCFFPVQTLCSKIIIQLKTLSAQSKMQVSGRLQVRKGLLRGILRLLF